MVDVVGGVVYEDVLCLMELVNEERFTEIEHISVN